MMVSVKEMVKWSLLVWFILVQGALGVEKNVGNPRAGLLKVMIGEQKKLPDWKGGERAYDRHMKKTGGWLSALDREGCEFLLDEMKRKRRYHRLVDKIWIRYGELDHERALKRLGGDLLMQPEGRSSRHAACHVLEGWGRHDPAAVWEYYDSFWRLNGSHPLHEAGEVSEMLIGVFGSWVAVDPDAAYRAMDETGDEDFRYAALGYYWGLGRDVNFELEGRKLEALFTSGRYRQWSSGSEGAELVLGRAMAAKWATKDADAAIGWWQNWDKKGLSSRGLSDSAVGIWSREGYWLGLLLAGWCGDGEVLDPDGVLRWMKAHPEWLERGALMEEVIPVLTKYRPEETLLLLESKSREGF